MADEVDYENLTDEQLEQMMKEMEEDGGGVETAPAPPAYQPPASSGSYEEEKEDISYAPSSGSGRGRSSNVTAPAAPNIKVYVPPASTNSYAPEPAPEPIPTYTKSSHTPTYTKPSHTYVAPPKTFVPQNSSSSEFIPQQELRTSVSDLRNKFGGGGGGGGNRQQSGAMTTGRTESEYARKHKAVLNKEAERVKEAETRREDEERQRQLEDQRREQDLEIEQERRRVAAAEAEAKRLNRQENAPYRSKPVTSPAQRKHGSRYSNQEVKFFEALDRRKFKCVIPSPLVLQTVKRQKWYTEGKLEEWCNDEQLLTADLRKCNIITTAIYDDQVRVSEAEIRKQEEWKELQRHREAMENSRQSLLPNDGISTQPSVAVPMPHSAQDTGYGEATRGNYPDAVRPEYDEGCNLCCCFPALFMEHVDPPMNFDADEVYVETADHKKDREDDMHPHTSHTHYGDGNDHHHHETGTAF